jgi:hypothetical protein
MIIELSIGYKEIKGNRAVTFEVYDNKGANQGTLIIGKGSVRWRDAKSSVYEKSKSWNELINWLREHGRTVKH